MSSIQNVDFPGVHPPCFITRAVLLGEMWKIRPFLVGDPVHTPVLMLHLGSTFLVLFSLAWLEIDGLMIGSAHYRCGDKFLNKALRDLGVAPSGMSRGILAAKPHMAEK